jgi:hydrogenase nickel incorporation protein HypA/HybF
MHELSLAASVLDIVRRHAAGRRVSLVRVDLGALQQVAPDALSFSFELLANGTEAEGAVLDVQPIAARGACARCGVVSELRQFPLQCSQCGSHELTIESGEELRVAYLEWEEADSEDRRNGRHT